MPLKIQQQYATQADALYNMAQGSEYFDDLAYSQSLAQGRGDEFILSVLGTEDLTTPDSFNDYYYNKLQGTDKLDYLSTQYYLDRNQTDTDDQGNTYNVYDKAMEYFDYQIEQIEAQETYENMNGFEKFLANTATIIGDTVNSIYSVIEGTVDAITLAVGGLSDLVTAFQFHEDISEGTKWAISQDLTGTGALAESLADFRSKYTRIDENDFLKFVDDAISGIAQNLTVFIPYVGPMLFYTSILGSSATDAVQRNPDIDIWSAIGYSAAVTAVEWGTEKVSGVIFGGQDITGHLLTGQPLRQTSNLFSHIGMDFVSEAFEEATSEFIDSVLDYAIVQADDSEIASFTDILYAGLVGGAVGALMGGGQIVTTRNMGVTKDGTIVYDYKAAKQQGLDVKKISKLDTVNIREALRDAQANVRTDYVEDVYAKYQQKGLTRQQITERHGAELARAQQRQNEVNKTITDAVGVLSKVYEYGGEQGFQKGVELAQKTIDEKRRLIREYTEYTPSTKANIAAIERKLNNNNPGSRAKINENLTATQVRVQDAFKKNGINLYYADFSEQNGNPKNHYVTIDERNVILDNRIFENADYDFIINKVAKQALVNSLQYRGGILNADAIKSLKEIIRRNIPYNNFSFDERQTLDFTDVDTITDSELKLYAEKQTELLAQMLLFDQSTIDTVFIGNTNIFKKMYNWLKRQSEYFRNFAKKSDLEKIQFNKVLKSMRMYEQTLQSLSPNQEYLNSAINDIGLNDEARDRVNSRYDPNSQPSEYGDWGYIPAQYSKDFINYYMATRELSEQMGGNIDYDSVFDPSSYSSEFVALISSNQQKGTNFKTILNNYLLNKYNIVIDQRHRQLVSAFYFKRFTNKEFINDLYNVLTGTVSIEAVSVKYNTLGSIFTSDFNRNVYDDINNTTLNDVTLTIIPTNREMENKARRTTDPQTRESKIVVFVNMNASNLEHELCDAVSSVYHETQHTISDWFKMYRGGDPRVISNGLRQVTGQKLKTLWDSLNIYNISYEQALTMYDLDSIRYDIADKIYDLLIGERMAFGDLYGPIDVFGVLDYFDISLNTNNNEVTITGYGIFENCGFSFISENMLNESRKKIDNPLKNLPGQTTKALQELATNTSGYHDELKRLIDDSNYVEDGKRYVSGVGDAEATNAAINIEYPNKTYATTVEYVDEVMNNGLVYAEYYYRYLHPDAPLNQPNTYKQIKQEVDLWLNTQPNSVINGFYSRIDTISTAFDNLKTKAGYKSGRRKVLNIDFDYSRKKMDSLRKEVGIISSKQSNKEMSFTRMGSTTTDDGESYVEDYLSAGMDVPYTDDDFSETTSSESGIEGGESGEESFRIDAAIDTAITTITNDLNSDRGFTIIDDLLETAEQLSVEIFDRTANKLHEAGLYTKEEYTQLFKTLKNRLSKINNLTEEERNVIDTDITTFNTLGDYYNHLSDLMYILDEHPTVEQQVRQVITETAPEVKEVATERAKETAKKPKIKTSDLSSEVLTKSGNKKTFYKGTNVANITEFDSSKGRKSRYIPGINWFVDNKNVAQSYAPRNTGVIYSVTLDITNPLVLDAEGRTWNVAFDGRTSDDIVREAQEKGIYDAVIFKNVVDTGTYEIVNETSNVIAVLDSSKINIIKEQSRQTEPSKKSVIQTEKQIRKEESRKVKEQTIPRENLNINDENQSKVNELKKMMTRKGVSEYQGDRFSENEAFTRASQEIFQENSEFFEKLTANDLQSMLNILQIEDFNSPYEEMQLQTAAYNLLVRYAYNNKNTQFKDIKEWITRKNQLISTSSAQFMGGLSATYGRHSVKSLLTEMEQLNNQTLNLPNEIVEATITDGTPIEQFKTSLLERSDEIEKQIKAEKDPQKKWELRREQSYIDNLYNALEDGDYALALDLFTEHLNELDEYQTQNQEKIAETYKQIVDFLVQNIDETGRFRTKKQSIFSPETKAKLVKAWSGIKSFRYLCMLSSPTTMGRNALSNTAVATQAIVEDLVSKGLEHIPSMYEATSQIKYTGDFDKAFSDYVDETYSNRINKDTDGDKYNSREKDTLRAEYAKEKDPLRKNKILGWIKRLEEKGLNDKRWTRRRVKRNLKNMLAGAHNQILWSAERALATRYKVKINRQNSDYRQQLIDKIAKTNPELADLYSRATSSDTAALTSIVQLGNTLHLDIMEQIYQKALYRANKLFFKIDNWFSRTESNLRRTHPFAAEILNVFQPFIRVSANTTIYTIDRSPIGLVKGLVKYLQTRQMVLSDMQQEIRDYYEKEYVKQNKKNNKEFEFEEKAFMEWMTSHSDAETMRAINGDKTAIKNVAQRLLDNGLISHMAIGADNMFSRGEAIESISQGMVGTSLMIVGMILAAVLDGFDYEDDDDYLGPILRIGDIKIRLTDLAPFSTLFVVGAMLGSDRVDDKFETIFSVIADQTLLNVVESALTYSNSLTDYLENQTINTLQSFIPAITKNIAKVWGNKKDKSGNFIDKLWKTTLSNTMFFNFLVADKINPYTGEPEKYYESGILEGIYNLISPIAVRVDVMSNFEREATRLGATTTGTSGNFTINGADYTASGKLKEQLGVFRADYINNEFDKIVNGRQTVTVEDEDGNYITTTYDKLTDKQKTNVIKRLYTKASDVTKIQYWLSNGNSYVVTNRDLYNTYRNLFNSSQILFRTSWSGSKFITR